MSIEIIKEIVQVQLGIKKVSIEDHFMNDLGAESFDILNIISRVEEYFRVNLDQSDLSKVKNINDLYELLTKG